MHVTNWSDTQAAKKKHLTHRLQTQNQDSVIRAIEICHFSLVIFWGQFKECLHFEEIFYIPILAIQPTASFLIKTHNIKREKDAKMAEN